MCRALKRCWTHTQRPSRLCSSHQTTYPWLWWRGQHSSGCGRRPAAGWSLSPSSWNAHSSPNCPPTGRLLSCRWCPARCAPRSWCFAARSCRAGRSPPMSGGCSGFLLWRCSHRWLSGRSSSLDRPENICRGPLCLSDKLKGKVLKVYQLIFSENLVKKHC